MRATWTSPYVAGVTFDPRSTMILFGPAIAVIVGLLRLPARIAYGATVAAWAAGAAALGAASWHDSRELPVGYWVAVVVSLAVAVGLCAGVRALRARRSQAA
jgi:peptidoglycan/LPS O-acetylase OafA/YrhL